tara:strand:+ start:137 stop:541 length:405 start_codon:yes stop_codon:yes gene_type:complete
MRYSYQREVIKNIVYSTDTHPTADWVFREVKKIIPSVSLGTVYRNLKQLENRGTIKTIYDGSIARYDRNRLPHNHLKCKICGNLIDIEFPKKEIAKLYKNDFDFKVEDISIIISGKCNEHTKTNNKIRSKNVIN